MFDHRHAIDDRSIYPTLYQTLLFDQTPLINAFSYGKRKVTQAQDKHDHVLLNFLQLWRVPGTCYKPQCFGFSMKGSNQVNCQKHDQQLHRFYIIKVVVCFNCHGILYGRGAHWYQLMRWSAREEPPTPCRLLTIYCVCMSHVAIHVK